MGLRYGLACVSLQLCLRLRRRATRWPAVPHERRCNCATPNRTAPKGTTLREEDIVGAAIPMRWRPSSLLISLSLSPSDECQGL